MKITTAYRGNILYAQCEDKRHNPCGPQIVTREGSLSWHLDGDWHRDGGPATIASSGTLVWAHRYREIKQINAPVWTPPRVWHLEGDKLRIVKANKRRV